MSCPACVLSPLYIMKPSFQRLYSNQILQGALLYVLTCSSVKSSFRLPHSRAGRGVSAGRSLCSEAFSIWSTCIAE